MKQTTTAGICKILLSTIFVYSALLLPIRANTAPLKIAIFNDYPPLTYIDNNEQPTGMLIELWKNWSKYTGRKIQFVVYRNWEQTVLSLKNGKTDIHSGLSKTQDRVQWIAFPAELYKTSLHFFYPKKYGLLYLRELRNAKVGVIAGTLAEQYLKQDYLNITVVKYQNYISLVKSAIDEKTIGFVEENLVWGNLHNMRYADVISDNPSPLLYSKIYAGCLKTNQSLAQTIKLGFDKIPLKLKKQIIDKWHKAAKITQPTVPNFSLSGKDKQWIKRHPVIRLGIKSNLLPYEAIDKNGKVIGFVADYISYTRNKTGFQFEIKSYPWPTIKNMLQTKELDATPFMVPTQKRVKNYLFTKPYLNLRTVILSRKNKYISGLNKLQGKSIAAIEGFVIIEMLKQDLPDIKIKTYPDIEKALQAVNSGEADFFIGALISAVYHRNKMGLQQLHVAGTLPYTYDVCFGVRKDWPELVDILNKAIDSIPEKLKDQFLAKWGQTQIRTDWKLAISISAIVLAIAIVAITAVSIWTHRLKQEILHRKKVEEELLYEEQRISTLGDNLADGAIFRLKIAPGGTRKITYLSKGIENITGLSIDKTKALFSTPEELIDPDKLEDFMTAQKEVESRRIPFKHETRIRTKDKYKDIVIRANPYTDNKGNTVYDGLILDITNEKKNAMEQENNLRFLQTLIDTIPGPVYYKDRNGVYTGCNRYFADKILGLPKEDIIGKNLFEFPGKIPKEQAIQYHRKDLELIYNPGVQIYEGKVNCPDQSERDYSFYKATFNDTEGNVAGIIGVMLDITKQKQTEAGLLRAKTEAEAANKAKDKFVSNVSHEIRNPMNAIIGLTQIILKGNLEPEQREQLETVAKASVHLLDIVNNILDMSKLEAGKMTIEKIPFNLSEIINEVKRIMILQAENKNNTLDFEINANITTSLIGDPLRIKQILINLINNAIKFTQNGSINVIITATAHSEDSLKLKFSVRDSGIGMSQEELSKLFQRFSQAKDSTARQFGGTGLGLVITRDLVELMDGKIDVESNLGIGSEFSFTIPLELQPEEHNTETEKLIEEEQMQIPENIKVLIAEDNKINQLVATEILKKVNIKPDIAENGTEAVEAVAKKEYDIVLMDVHMPEMDGLEATRKIREMPNRTNLPIVAMSACSTTYDIDDCLNAGMNDLLTKPFMPEQLFEIILKYVPAAK
jgi:PAS domain S-box-containing protein